MSTLKTLNLTDTPSIRASSSTDGLTMEGLDQMFIREVFGNKVMTLSTFTSMLYNRMHSLYIRGEFKGYVFLFEMPEYDALRWVRVAIINLQRLHERMPDDFPPAGVRESFDRIRKWRKSKRPNS